MTYAEPPTNVRSLEARIRNLDAARIGPLAAFRRDFEDCPAVARLQELLDDDLPLDDSATG